MPSPRPATWLIAGTFAATLWSLRAIEPPAVVPADAPAERFSAARAEPLLREIARAPRPLGSAENARVRQWLVTHLEGLGLEVESQPAVVTNAGSRWGVATAHVTNVLARLRGTRPGKALVLMAHHDSVAAGPGAGDDASGVATLLETARALKAGPPLANDVLFLFTDGEELGLFGARAFVEQSPQRAEVGVVLNFEARGNRGPSTMFEASAGNGELIRALAQGPRVPVAYSFAYEVYKRLPNDTDFSVFKRAGIPGLNFAFIHNTNAYHTAQDNLERLDLRSVQHHGSYALALARELGNRDLTASLVTTDKVYAPLLGLAFVRYPVGWALPIALLLGLALVWVLTRAVRSGRVGVAHIVVGALRTVAGVAVVSVFFAFTARFVMGTTNFAVAFGRSSVALHLLAASLIATGIAIGLMRVLMQPARREGLYLGGLTIVWLLTLALSIVAPGGSYMFAWPLIPALAAAWLRVSGLVTTPTHPAYLTALGLLALLTAAVWGPTLGLLGAALEVGAAGLVAGAVFLLATGLLGPAFLCGWPDGTPQRLPALLVVAGILVTLLARSGSDFSAENRRPSVVWYGLDATSGEARWWSFAPPAEPWSRALLGAAPAPTPAPAYAPFLNNLVSSPAPLLELPPLAFAAEQQGETLRLTAGGWSTPPARVVLRLARSAPLTALRVDGQSVDLTGHAASDEVQIVVFGPRAQGIEIELAPFADAVPVDLETLEVRLGLPAPPLGPGPRPADTMAGGFPFADTTLRWSATRVAITPAGAEGQP